MTQQPLTLREARRYGALAVATTLTTSTAVGAGTALAVGPYAGLAAGGLTALATTWGALGGLRLLLTRPRATKRA